MVRKKNPFDRTPSGTPHPRFVVAGIGASAGGIRALESFFSEFSDSSPMALVVILHLSPEHESHLAEVLQRKTQLSVKQVRSRIRVKPNHVYVIPPAKDLVMVDGHIAVTEPESPRGQRAPINLFFSTLADAYGADAIGIVLSGMGADGTLGLQRIKEQGGITIAQDPEEAEFEGMPRSAVASGAVDLVLPVAQIPQWLRSLQERSGELAIPAEEDEPQDVELESLREALGLLRLRTGHDFSGYKRPTLLRRFARRLQVTQKSSLQEYLEHLRASPQELQSLMRDMLITVTHFFRDREAFAVLEKEVIPKLFDERGSQDHVRVWVCGCASGEEAYSIGILLLEQAARMDDPPQLQIFATDIDEMALRFGRDGLYPETIASDVTPERLRQFFAREGESYRVKSELREIVLFAPQNVLRDPPFCHLDLVSCRNMLIYMNRDVQNRVMDIFHFALLPAGYLFLGSAESTDSASDAFVGLDRKNGLFQRRSGVGTQSLRVPTLLSPVRWAMRHRDRPPGVEPQASFAALHLRLFEQCGPPSVLVNSEHEILHMSETAGRFLRFGGGEPTRNLLQVIHPDLRLELRSMLFGALQPGSVATSAPVALRIDGQDKLVQISVHAASRLDAARGMMLVTFEDRTGSGDAREGARRDGEANALTRHLEEELERYKQHLAQTIQQYETSTEELKASNEEFQAINEELRSASEEMETGKEELQSVNEELITVNQELKAKIEELARANADLQNLMASTEIGTIFLDRSLRILRYTPPVDEVFNIIPTDVGRPLEHLTHKTDYVYAAEDAQEVLRTLHRVERAVTGNDGRNYVARMSPYRSGDDRIDGLVLTFVDVTDLTLAEERLRGRDSMLRMVQHAVTAGVWEIFFEEGKSWMSPESYVLYGLEDGPKAAYTTNWTVRFPAAQREQLSRDLLRAATAGEDFRAEFTILHPTRGMRRLWEFGRAESSQGRPLRMTGITFDITELSVVLPETSADGDTDERMEAWGAQLDELARTLRAQLERAASPGATAARRTQVRAEIDSQLERLDQIAASLRAQSGSEERGASVTKHGPEQPLDGERKRILVVDDSDDVTDCLARLLRGRGNQVHVASTGGDAIRMADELEPDVVLLDIGLPDKDGYEVARAIRAKRPDTALIAVTGWGQPRDLARSRAAGFDHHMTKPIEFGALVGLLQKL